MKKESGFYVVRIGNRIDRKINLAQRDLMLAFTSGRLYGIDMDCIHVFYVDLDSVTVTKIPVSEILEQTECGYGM